MASSLSPEEATSSLYQNEEQHQLLSKNDERIKLSIDDIIELCGMGKFQYFMLLVTGICFGSDAVEITLLSFLSPTLEAEWNLEPWQSSTIAAVVFVGAFIGTLLFGRLGDLIGRRPTFLYGAFTISVFGFATSFAKDFCTLLAIRFVVGMGVGGMVVPFDLLAEFLPTGSRGRLLAMIEYFWTCGSMFVPLAAAATLAYSWRILVSICALPCLASAVVAFFFLPESPRWLVVQGRPSEALHILQQVATMNGLDPPTMAHWELQSDQHAESTNRSELFKLTPLLWLLWVLSAFCYYATVILITRIFETTSAPECDLLDDCPKEDAAVTFDYAAIFVSSSAEVVGTALLMALLDLVGRVPTQVVSYTGGGISMTLLCLVAAAARGTVAARMMLPLAYIARVFELMASATAYVITAELLPTDIRTTGHGAAYAVARLGSSVSSYMASSPMPLLWIGAILLVAHIAAAICSAQLPETKGRFLGNAMGQAGNAPTPKNATQYQTA